MDAFATLHKTESKQNGGNNFFGNAKNGIPFIQPKLTINNPNDLYEQEADAMADKVMRMEQPGIQLKPLPITSVQRKCAHCEEEEKKMQRKKMNDSETAADNNLESYIGNLSNTGQSLPNEVRNFYEPRFGYDFSNVKVHTDTVAAKSAQSINALAYTSGDNIVFNSNQYSPNTDTGKRLLGHELTHVVQQGNGINKKSIQRLVRSSLVTCAAGQNPFGADRRASALLTNAVTLIDNAVAARPADPANADVTTVGNAMRTAFRLNPANDSNWNDPAPHFGLPLIRRRLDAAKNYIDSVVFTFNCVANGTNHTIPGCATFACAAGTEAVSCHNNATEMVLCPDFWALSTNQRARTYLHEVLHITFRVVDDWGQPDQHNAHCYAQFVALLNGFNSPAGFRCH
ncbi:MAG TPA: DUF4157 domain-containing protein [Hanamia sp.]|nr:DUF4157 domain-containing protein [Hanamia sp.]